MFFSKQRLKLILVQSIIKGLKGVYAKKSVNSTPIGYKPLQIHTRETKQIRCSLHLRNDRFSDLPL